MMLIQIFDDKITKKYYDIISYLNNNIYCNSELIRCIDLENYLNFLNENEDSNFKFFNDAVQTILVILRKLYELYEMQDALDDENKDIIKSYIDLYSNYIINFIIKNNAKLIDIDETMIYFYLYFSLADKKISPMSFILDRDSKSFIKKFLFVYSEKINNPEEIKIIFEFINK